MNLAKRYIRSKGDKMKIAILGSTGFLGKVILKQALERGYRVKTLVRTPDKLGEFKDRVEFIKGSLSDIEKLEQAVSDTDAVVSAVGPPQRHPEPPEFYEKIMQELVGLLEKQNIKRFIHTGGAVHLGGEREAWSLGRRMLRFFLVLFGKSILIAKEREWAVLKNSNLDWTLVRPPHIVTGEPTGQVSADEKNLVKTRVNVEDLANFMLDQITSTAWIKKAPLVSSKKLKRT
ncbi:NAD(P)H-binding protein [candidate division KSB1 bacterium]|nr:NAD(P)H-binding protein [candidate division KSB1 bacterium]